MWRGFLFVLLAGIVVSGCAGQRYAQELNQLKSDVGLLDQRVSQLERTSSQPPSSAEWPTEIPARASTTMGTESAAVKPATTLPSKPSSKDIQEALNAAGFYQGPVDGKIGPQTREAIRQFQQANGLKVDGVAGRQTWEKLAPYLQLSSTSGELSTAQPLK